MLWWYSCVIKIVVIFVIPKLNQNVGYKMYFSMLMCVDVYFTKVQYILDFLPIGFHFNLKVREKSEMCII